MSRLNYTNQHLLANEEISKYIAAVSEIDPDDHVLEIGGGMGALTKEIQPYGAKIMVVEKDPTAVKCLENLAKSFNNIEVVPGNILTMKWPRSITRVIGNIPFNISEPLFEKMFNQNFKSVTLLVGKSLAEEIEAYSIGKIEEIVSSRLGILIDAHFNVEMGKTIFAEEFDPKPRTDGVVISLYPIKKRDLSEVRRYLIRSIWDQKTKRVEDSLYNGFSNYLAEKNSSLLISKDSFMNCLNLEYGIPETPGFSLTSSQMHEIYARLNEKAVRKKLFKLNRQLLNEDDEELPLELNKFYLKKFKI